MFETYYEPTTDDLRDWAAHCAMVEYDYEADAEDDDQDEDDFDDSMDGDAESALASVYGPNE